MINSISRKASPIEKWRRRNLYYYKDLENLYQFLVQPNSIVLEMKTGLGYLLNAVRPQQGLGIYLLNVRIKDSFFGIKPISKQNYQKLAANRNYFGDFDPFGDFDLLFGSSKLGLKTKDIPVRYFAREYGRSNIQHFKEGLVLLKMCLYAAWKIKAA